MLHIIDSLAVEEDGEGDAVLCLHGLGGDSNTWTPLMPALAGYRACVPISPAAAARHMPVLPSPSRSWPKRH